MPIFLSTLCPSLHTNYNNLHKMNIRKLTLICIPHGSCFIAPSTRVALKTHYINFSPDTKVYFPQCLFPLKNIIFIFPNWYFLKDELWCRLRMFSCIFFTDKSMLSHYKHGRVERCCLITDCCIATISIQSTREPVSYWYCVCLFPIKFKQKLKFSTKQYCHRNEMQNDGYHWATALYFSYNYFKTQWKSNLDIFSEIFMISSAILSPI